MCAKRTRVLIVGAGPAGATLACLLARAGVDVSLIDRQSDDHAPRIGETLPPAIKPLLLRLGLWEAFLRDEPLPSYGVQSLWGADTPELYSFIANPHGSGFHVRRECFDAMLRRAAREAGATLSLGIRIGAVERGGRGFRITSAGPRPQREWSADWVVDASGRSAAMARKLGATQKREDRLIGVVGFFAANPEPGRAMLIEPIESGWWYTAPLPANRVVSAFMTDAALWTRSASQLDRWQRLRHSAPFTAQRTGTERPVRPLLVTQAHSGHLTEVCGPGWLALGDAAICRDPLSGGGVYEAMRGALAASEVILTAPDSQARALADYSAAVRRALSAHLTTRRRYYALETRFAAAPFWRRMTQAY